MTNPLRDASGKPISRDAARIKLLEAGWDQNQWGNWYCDKPYAHAHTLKDAWAAHLAWLEVAPIGGQK